MQRYICLFFITLVSYLALTSFHVKAQATQSEQVTELPQEPNDQTGDYRWVSEDLFTYLRAGPGNNYRLLGSVNAGTKIQLLQLNREAGYAEIIDSRQRTGWIEIRYVSNKPSSRDAVKDLEALLKNKNENIEIMQAKMQAMTQNLNASDNHKSKLNRQVTAQLEELSRLNEQMERRERANNMQWFTRGSILAIIALVIGYLMGIFGRRRSSQNRLL